MAASFFYLLLTIILTWPLVIEPSAGIIGAGDAYHHVWILWHTKEALLQQDGWFNTSYLFYPHGISLWVHPLGPLLGLVSLPFWSFGPEVAYNAAVFFGFWATGIAMHVLARELDFSWAVSLFAGTLYLAAPLHLLALYGHTNRTVLAFLPLSLWAYHRALDPKRDMKWPAIAGIVLLLTLLYSTEQFIFAGIAFAIYGIIRLLMGKPSERRSLLVHIAATAGATILFCGFPLFQVWRASHSMGIGVAVNLQSFTHHPDLIQLFLPVGIGWPLYARQADWLRPIIMAPLETTIFLTWTAIALSAIAIVRRIRPAKEWVYFLVVCIFLSLGPSLRVLGETTFTNYDIPVILPYAFLTSISGLDHMRTPGRFMVIGHIGLAIVASYGLAWITERLSHKTIAYLLITVAITISIVETWMHPLLSNELPPVSNFYHQIAEDPEPYGIFDLPIRPDGIHEFDSWHIFHSSLYQMLQMVHRKGIATGYLSRYYEVHPTFGQLITENHVGELPDQRDIFLNDLPANRYANMMYELARNNFRYVIVHKTSWNGEPMPEWGTRSSQTFVDEVFGEREPTYEDELITVYAVDALPDVSTLEYGIVMLEPSDAQPNWDLNHRRIQSPAQFVLFSPKAALVDLELELMSLLGTDMETSYESGVLEIRSGDTLVYSTPVVSDEKMHIPLVLRPGSQVFTFTIIADEPASGKHSADYLYATIEKMNLNQADIPDLFLISEGGQRATLLNPNEDSGKTSVLLQGWYGEEATADGTMFWNWAESPARIAVYSPAPTPMVLTATPVALHDPDSPSGKGSSGVLRVRNGTEPPAEFTIEAGKPFSFDFATAEGWNMITLDLATGNFQPIAYEPASGDTRSLSFALSDLDVKRAD